MHKLAALFSLLGLGAQALAFSADDIRPVYFPAVPEGWEVAVIGNTLEYRAPRPAASQFNTTVAFTYSINTDGADASTLSKKYAKEKSCADPQRQGIGFYSIKCSATNTFAIIIGEPDNMYRVELIGTVTDASHVMVESYVNSIIKGKHVFVNRDIGDVK